MGSICFCCKNFLGNRKSSNYKELVKELTKSFQVLGCNMSIKLHFFNSHLQSFPAKLGDVSDEQGEHFQQEIEDRCWVLEIPYSHQLPISPAVPSKYRFHKHTCICWPTSQFCFAALTKGMHSTRWPPTPSESAADPENSYASKASYSLLCNPRNSYESLVKKSIVRLELSDRSPLYWMQRKSVS